MPILMGTTSCDVSAVEVSFRLRFSDTEKFALVEFSKTEIEIVAKYELEKMRLNMTTKLYKLQRRIGKTELESQEHYNISEEIDFLERKVKDVEKRLGIRI